MKLLLIRHGQTDENAANRYVGHTDVKLNDCGRQQMELTAKLVRETYHSVVTSMYCSDLARARESASILGKYLHIHPRASRALRELNFGMWEGQTYESIPERELLQSWIQNPFHLSPPQGETLEQLGMRVDQWLSSMLEQHSEEEATIIVSHGGPIRWLVASLVYKDINRFWDVAGVVHGGGIVLEKKHGTKWDYTQL